MINGVSNYSATLFELLHNLQLEIFKLLKECTVKCPSSDKLRPGGSWKKTKPFVKIRARALQGCNTFLNVIKSNESVQNFV